MFPPQQLNLLGFIIQVFVIFVFTAFSAAFHFFRVRSQTSAAASIIHSSEAKTLQFTGWLQAKFG